MIIPEVILASTISVALDAIREDYVVKLQLGQKSRSVLYLLFKENSYLDYDYLENAVRVVVTEPSDPRHIRVKLSYDNNVANLPQIFIHCPGESTKNNEIGIGINEDILLQFDNSPDRDEYNQQMKRRYNSTYQIVTMSDNKQEETIMYHLIKAIMTNFMDHMALSGLENLQIGGGDISFPRDLGTRLFSKAVTVNFEYNQVVPDVDFSPIYRKVLLYWKPEGAEIAQGPIVIETQDDVSWSDDDSES